MLFNNNKYVCACMRARARVCEIIICVIHIIIVYLA